MQTNQVVVTGKEEVSLQKFALEETPLKTNELLIETERTFISAGRLRGLFEWIADGRLKLKPLITQVMAPGQIKAAYDGLLHKKDEYVGVVLKWKN